MADNDHATEREMAVSKEILQLLKDQKVTPHEAMNIACGIVSGLTVCLTPSIEEQEKMLIGLYEHIRGAALILRAHHQAILRESAASQPTQPGAQA